MFSKSRGNKKLFRVFVFIIFERGDIFERDRDGKTTCKRGEKFWNSGKTFFLTTFTKPFSL